MILKTSPKVYLIRMSFPVAFLGLVLYQFFDKCPTVDLPFVIGVVVFVIGMFIWLYLFRLTLSPEQIEYRTLLGGVQTMQRDQLKHYKFEWGERIYADRFKPYHRLILSPKKRGGEKIIVNYKVFDKKALQELLKALDTDIENNKKPKTAPNEPI